MDSVPAPPSDKAPKAVVIGSGFGGLAAAVRLAAKGYRVIVCERLDGPGGRAYTYRQDGFVFDAGPTIVTAPYLFDELWEVAGRKLQDDVDLRPIDPFYEIRFDDGEVIACTGDHDRMRAEVAGIAPEDLDGFDKFMASARRSISPLSWTSRTYRSTASAYQIRARPGSAWQLRYRLQQGQALFLERETADAFSFHPLLIGGNPTSTTAYYCLISHLERLHGSITPWAAPARWCEGLSL